MAMSFNSLRSSHWKLGSTTKKAAKNPTKGLQTKIPGKAKTLQNKGFAPKCGEAPGAKKHQKKQRKNTPKTQKRRTKQKSQVKPNTCKIKGLPRNLAKPRAPKEKAKKREKQKNQNGLKVFVNTFWALPAAASCPSGKAPLLFPIHLLGFNPKRENDFNSKLLGWARQQQRREGR